MKPTRIYPLQTALILIFAGLLLSCAHKRGIIAKESHEFPDVTASLIVNNRVSAQPWTMDDASSEVKFTIRNLGFKVNGTFKGLKATIHFEDKNLKESSLEGVIDVTTIETGIKKRDRDLQAKKYFNSEKHKEIIFRSESVIRTGATYTAKGILTIKGTSLNKDIPFTFEQNGDKGEFKSKFTINRRDYDVGGGWPMSDELTVSMTIVVNKD